MWRSFWMGGFEGADHVNGRGQPLDMTRSSGHLEQLDSDYARLRRLGVLCVRESVGWRLSERSGLRGSACSGVYDFTRLARLTQAAQHHGIQLLWTLMHYGTPSDVDLRNDRFIPRFARFAAAVARYLKPFHDAPPVYTPINEISFLAWALTETHLIRGYGPDHARAADTRASGWEMKRRLVRAALAAIDAILQVDARARFLHIDPLVHVAAPPHAEALAALAQRICDYQWQAWDMLAGRSEPDLGGHARALDLIGVNHYHSGQWEVLSEKRLAWHLRDPRRRPFSAQLAEVWSRYQRPLIVAETGHVGAGRAAWLDEVAAQVQLAQAQGVPVGGLCLYPIVDRHDWDDPTHWHHSGLWDHLPTPSPSPLTQPERPAAITRRLNLPYARCLKSWQRRLPQPQAAQAQREAQAGQPAVRPDLLALSRRPWRQAAQSAHPLLLQLAQHYRVWIIEAPQAGDTAPFVEQVQGAAQITVLRLHLASAASGWHAEQLSDQLGELLPVLEQRLRLQGVNDYVAWCDTPAAWPLLARLKPLLTLYDQHECRCGRPADAPCSAAEAALLQAADLVLNSRDHQRLAHRAALGSARRAGAEPRPSWEEAVAAQICGFIDHALPRARQRQREATAQALRPSRSSSRDAPPQHRADGAAE